MWNEIRRKIFHLCGLIYVIGLVYIPRPAYPILLTVLVALIFLLEQARLRVPSVRALFFKYGGTLFREHEYHRLSGVFWMAEGVWVTVMLMKSVPLAATAILYLLLGDTMASLAGKRLRGPKWPRSDKSISGSLACFFMCLFVGWALLRPNYYGWDGIVIGALVATIAEALPSRLNDNFTIPAAATLAFLFCFGW